MSALLYCSIPMLSLLAAPDASPWAHFATEPVAMDYAARRMAYIEQLADKSRNGDWETLARLALGRDAGLGAFHGICDELNHLGDCDDFAMLRLLRLVYQFPEALASDPALADEVRDAMLGFKYWPEEGGADSMCSWTENHQIAYCVDAYLAGQRYPDAVFARTGQTGREKMARFRPRIDRWLELRFRTGFSEWLSNVYYSLDIAALALLMDFAEEAELRTRAAMVLDTMIADMALNSFHGIFGSTHGRSYDGDKKHARHENTTATEWLLFGMGWPKGGATSAASLALSPRFQLAPVFEAIARDTLRDTFENRQRMGIRIEDAEKWGLGFDNFEDGMVWLSLEAYCHPKVINLTMDMFDAYRWWENDYFKAFAKNRGMIDRAREKDVLARAVRHFEKDVCRNTREEANIYTYKTPDYMLSTAQDYRKGYGGDQQHIWQATLGVDAFCFTTHPARENDINRPSNDTPDYWTGSGTLPRAAQYKNVVFALYDIDTRAGLYITNELLFTHAWLPCERFDEIVERDGWFFARKDSAWLALYSQQPCRWEEKENPEKKAEIIAEGKRNVWICELGSAAENGSFEQFMDGILGARLECGELDVAYESPSQGLFTFAWDGPLLRNSAPVQLDDYPRYGSPYAQAAFPADEIRFECAGHSLLLDWPRATRTVE